MGWQPPRATLSAAIPSADAGQHARLIEAVIRGRDRGAGIHDLVRRSWARCLAEYSLNPAKARSPAQIDRYELSRRRAQAGAALAITEVEIRHLHTRLNDHFGVVLTDLDQVLRPPIACPDELVREVVRR